MKKHIKSYNSQGEFFRDIGVGLDESLYVAYINGNNEKSVHYTSENQIVESSEKYKNQLDYLTALVNELLAKDKRDEYSIYLFESEYEKLKNGQEAIDIYGEIIPENVRWDDITYTFYVCEEPDNEIIVIPEVVDNILDLSEFEVVDGVIDLSNFGYVDEDGYFVFASDNSSIPSVNEDGILDLSDYNVDDNNYIDVSDIAVVEDGILIIE